MRCRGGLAVDFDWRDHWVRRLVVRRLGGDESAPVRIEWPGHTAELKLATGEHRSLPC
jgi:alpha-L-fucosidase 2